MKHKLMIVSTILLLLAGLATLAQAQVTIQAEGGPILTSTWDVVATTIDEYGHADRNYFFNSTDGAYGELTVGALESPVKAQFDFSATNYSGLGTQGVIVSGKLSKRGVMALWDLGYVNLLGGYNITSSTLSMVLADQTIKQELNYEAFVAGFGSRIPIGKFFLTANALWGVNPRLSSTMDNFGGSPEVISVRDDVSMAEYAVELEYLVNENLSLTFSQKRTSRSFSFTNGGSINKTSEELMYISAGVKANF